MQGLPYDEPYVAVFENMDTVVFFNGCGQEAQLWLQYAGAVLPTREIEGRASHAPSSGNWQELLDVWWLLCSMMRSCVSGLSTNAVCACVGCAIDTGPEALSALEFSQLVCEHRDSAKWLARCNAKFSLEWNGCHVQLISFKAPRAARAEFRVFVRPRMSNDSMILPDSIGLKAAQPDQIKTIAYLLAQTVALHFYETCAGAKGLGLGLPYPSRTLP